VDVARHGRSIYICGAGATVFYFIPVMLADRRCEL
jgi:hypothetical protein